MQVKIEKLNPQVSLVYAGTTRLTGAGDEQTAIRFRLNALGEVVAMTRRGKYLIRATPASGQAQKTAP